MGPPAPAPTAAPGRSTLPTRFGDKVVSFTLPRLDSERPRADERPAGAPAEAAGGTGVGRDWSSAIDLIHEASEAIRISHDRSVELEAQLAQTVSEATAEIQRLNAQIAAGEQALAATEERLRASEARASEAEGWLVRLHDSIYSAFTANPRTTERAEADGAGGGEAAPDRESHAAQAE